MSRPEQVSCINTAEGIYRINEMQRHYDENPEQYEAEEQRREIERQQEAEYEREQYEAVMAQEGEGK